ncbi:MAG TPA: amino acid adenylation domain-containing protein, partial [Thermoanaerobaculia bacterium]|nr:amino acid adenylation domain-containing protein [Thermoanaerobaculia bacterium]
LRSTLLRLSPERHLALLTLHHIVADGWSMDVFVRELAAFYGAALAGRPAWPPMLAPLPIQYADFAVWQRGWLAGPELERQLGWWRQRLAGAPTLLELPTDRPRPPVLSPSGGAVPVTLPRETAAGLAALARAAEATPFMLLLAGFSALLARYTRQEDLLVGAPVANRTHREIEGLIGFFVNTLALRTELAGRPPFRELVGRVREMALGAYAHQDLPFERLVEELQPARDLSRSPLCQVLLVLQNTPASPFALPGLTLEPVEVDAGVTKLDLQLTLAEAGGVIAGTLTYAADLFERSTVERMAGQLATLLAGAVADPGRTLAELSLLSPAEQAQLAGWNATATAYADGERTLPELFARQAAATPHAVAATNATTATTADAAGAALTYAELAARTCALAARLRGLGVGPETVVGLCAERSLDMIVALLGILAAGGAYLPLDPSYPAERLASMIADAEVPVILVQERLLGRLPAHAAKIARLVLLEDIGGIGGIGRAASSAAGPAAVPDDLAYVIFTSGSTGKPKGVMNSHRGIVNRILWMQEQYGLNPADRVLQKTPYSFDVSVWEFFWPLLFGARLVFAQPGGHQDSAYLVRTIVLEGITVTHFVPSMLAAFLAEPDVERCTALTRVMASGEALPFDLLEQYSEVIEAPLHNLYGPTEAAVDVTYWECDPASPRRLVPIGRPVANTRIHLLDRAGQEVPIGVPGELFIGGVQLALGYLGRPDTTAEKFLPDPFAALVGGEPGGRLYRTGDVARHLPDGA